MPPAILAPAAVAGLGLTAGSLSALFVAAGVSLAVTVAAAAAQQFLFRDDAVTSPVDLSNQQTKRAVKQAIPSQRIILGRASTSGAYCYYRGGPPFLIISYLLANHECDAIEGAFIQGDELQFDSNGDVTSSPYFDGADAFVRMSFRLGTDAQVIDPIIVAAFPETPSTFRQVGHTVATYRADFHGPTLENHNELWTQNIDPIFRVRGLKVFDPRDAAHDVDDPSTWTWTDNAALCTVAAITRPEIGRRMTLADFDLEALKDAAHVCDEAVGTLDGTAIKRYTINGVINTSQAQLDVIESMLTASHGRLIWANNKFQVQPETRQSPVRTITQEWLAGGFDYRAGAPVEQNVNVVRAKFVSEKRDFQTQDMPILTRAAAVTEDQGEEAINIELAFTENASRAQRLAKITLEQARLQRSVDMVVDTRAIELTAEDVVNVQFDDFSYVNGVYRVNKAVLSSRGDSIQLSLVETSEQLTAWDPSVDEQAFETTIINPDNT